MPYTYSWTGPISGSVSISDANYKIEQFPSGDYTVTVLDANGCMREKTISVKNIGGTLSVSLSMSTSVACEHDGTTLVTIIGGTGPYTISYTGVTNGSVVSNESNFQLPGLLPGEYTVNVTDSNGCIGYQKIKIYNNGTDLEIETTLFSLCTTT